MKSYIAPLQNSAGIFLLFLSLTACKSDIFDKQNGFETKWKGKLNAPLGYMNFDPSQITKQLGKDADIKKDANGFLKLKKEIDINQTPTAFDISSKTQTISFESKTALVIPPGAPDPYTVPSGSPMIKSHTTPQNTKIESVSFSKELTSIHLKGGNIELTINSTFDIETTLEVECTSLVNRTNSTTFKRNIRVPKKGNILRNFGSLGDYDLDLSNDGTGTGKTSNKIVFKARIIYTIKANDKISASDKINATVAIKNISASKVFGDFKSETIVLKSQEIDLFPKQNNFKIEIEEPKIEMTLNNGYGVPMGITPDKIVAKGTDYSGSTPTPKDVKLSYTNAATKNLLFFDGATYDNVTKTVTKKETNLSIDKSNSNLVDFFKSSPEKIKFDIEATTNPNAVSGTPNKNFYADSEKKIEGKLTVTLPLSIKLEEFEYTKEQDFKVNAEFEKYVENFDLVFYTKNTLPLEAEVTPEFLDSSGGKITFKSTINVIKITADKDNKETISKNAITFNKEDLENFNKVKKIKFVVKLKSTGTGFVKLYEQNKMEIQLSIRGNGKYERK